ncbi:MAG: Lrp/AsnC family transcriptional regulator [Pseudomonadota bacterium]
MTNFVTTSDQLDVFDHRILSLVQNNSDATHSEIGALVGLSGSAVRRRLKRMKGLGVIQKSIAVLDPDQFGVTVIVELNFKNETPQIYEDFDRQMLLTPEVQQSYYVAGSSDYMLVVHAPTLQRYEEWAKSALMSNENIERYNTRVVWSRKKFGPFIKFPERE